MMAPHGEGGGASRRSYPEEVTEQQRRIQLLLNKCPTSELPPTSAPRPLSPQSPLTEVIVTDGLPGDYSPPSGLSRSLPERSGGIKMIEEYMMRHDALAAVDGERPLRIPGAPSPVRRKNSLERVGTWSGAGDTSPSVVASGDQGEPAPWLTGRSGSPPRLLPRRSLASISGSALHPSKASGNGALSPTPSLLASRSADMCFAPTTRRRASSLGLPHSSLNSVSVVSFDGSDSSSSHSSTLDLLASPSRKDSIQLPRIGENDVLPPATNPNAVRRTKSLNAAVETVDGAGPSGQQIMRKLSFTTHPPELAGDAILEMSESRPGSGRTAVTSPDASARSRQQSASRRSSLCHSFDVAEDTAPDCASANGAPGGCSDAKTDRSD
eukprot:Opistho-1_new@20227